MTEYVDPSSLENYEWRQLPDGTHWSKGYADPAPAPAHAIPTLGVMLIETFDGYSDQATGFVAVPRHVLEAALRELGERS